MEERRLLQEEKARKRREAIEERKRQKEEVWHAALLGTTLCSTGSAHFARSDVDVCSKNRLSC